MYSNRSFLLRITFWEWARLEWFLPVTKLHTAKHSIHSFKDLWRITMSDLSCPSLPPNEQDRRTNEERLGNYARIWLVRGRQHRLCNCQSDERQDIDHPKPTFNLIQPQPLLAADFCFCPERREGTSNKYFCSHAITYVLCHFGAPVKFFFT